MTLRGLCQLSTQDLCFRLSLKRYHIVSSLNIFFLLMPYHYHDDDDDDDKWQHDKDQTQDPCSRPSLKRYHTISSFNLIWDILVTMMMMMVMTKNNPMKMMKMINIILNIMIIYHYHHHHHNTGFCGETRSWELGCNGSNFYKSRTWYHRSVSWTIIFAIWTNIFCKLDKYIAIRIFLPRQIPISLVSDLNKYLCNLDKNVLKSKQIYL